MWKVPLAMIPKIDFNTLFLLEKVIFFMFAIGKKNKVIKTKLRAVTGALSNSHPALQRTPPPKPSSNPPTPTPTDRDADGGG